MRPVWRSVLPDFAGQQFDCIRTTSRQKAQAKVKPAEADIPHIFSASRVPGFTDGMLWKPPETLDELYGPLEKNLAAWRSGTAYTFTVETSELAFVGRVALRQTAQDRIWNLGFWTHPEQQGRGYTAEAAAAVLQLGFTRLGAEHVEACHALWNLKSRRVLEKLGMTFVKRVPEGFQKNGVWMAEDCLGVSREKWLNLREMALLNEG